MKQQKYAVIYPFLPEHIERVLNGRDVVCKYCGRGKPSISEGSKLLLYASGGKLELIGEGEIKSMEFLTPQQMITKYKEKLFLTPTEVDGYRGARSPERNLLVLTLSKIRRFSQPIKRAKYVTMAGEMLTKEQYLDEIREVRRTR